MKRKISIRKLILSLSTVGLLALTTTTSTYAWFKLNSKATVENFDFEVIGGKGFMVSIDGGTYTNDLKKEQIEKAMLVSISDGKYELGYEKDDTGKITKSDVVYEISYEHGVKIKKEVEDVDALLERNISKIEMSPVTSRDGRTFENLVGVKQGASTGSYVEFGVYFKSTSNNPNDNLKYDIYLDGYGGLDNDGNKVLPTAFTSAETDVILNTDMNAVLFDENGNKYLPYTPGESHQYTYLADGTNTIRVYSTNAARISTTVGDRVDVEEKYELTTDTSFGDKIYYTFNGTEYVEVNVNLGDEVLENTYYEHYDAKTIYEVDPDSSNIYEINDSQYGKYDLGSYATTYNHLTDGYNLDDYYLYSSECNAMYTYYNNLRQSSPLTGKEFIYGEQPKTIKSLPTVSSDDSSLTYDKIVQVESGGDEKLVTFRIWLEGWDADCFDGLSNAIKVRLALGSKRVN